MDAWSGWFSDEEHAGSPAGYSSPRTRQVPGGFDVYHDIGEPVVPLEGDREPASVESAFWQLVCIGQSGGQAHGVFHQQWCAVILDVGRAVLVGVSEVGDSPEAEWIVGSAGVEDVAKLRAGRCRCAGPIEIGATGDESVEMNIHVH